MPRIALIAIIARKEEGVWHMGFVWSPRQEVRPRAYAVESDNLLQHQQRRIASSSEPHDDYVRLIYMASYRRCELKDCVRSRISLI